MTEISRITDQSTGDPCGAPPRPSNKGSPDVYAEDLAVHRNSDSWVDHACPESPPHGASTTSGSPTVYANGLQVARIGDSISCGSTINQGAQTVWVNEGILTIGGVTLPANQNSFKNAEVIIDEIGFSAIDDEFEVNDGAQVYPPVAQTTPPPPIPQEEISVNDDTPAEEPDAPLETDCTMIALPINYDFQLSPHFKLRELSIGAVFPHAIKAQNGRTESEIVCNLKALAENILEPLRAQFGVFRINSGFRTRQNGRSQHESGMACDISFTNKSYNEMYEIAQWAKDNLNYDQLLWEHGNRPWIHISFNRAGNRPKSASNAVMTMYNDKFSPGLKKIAGYA